MFTLCHHCYLSEEGETHDEPMSLGRGREAKVGGKELQQSRLRPFGGFQDLCPEGEFTQLLRRPKLPAASSVWKNFLKVAKASQPQRPKSLKDPGHPSFQVSLITLAFQSLNFQTHRRLSANQLLNVPFQILLSP